MRTPKLPPSHLRLASVAGLPTWMTGLRLTDKGKPIIDAYNVSLALDAAPETQGRFGYDEMLRGVVIESHSPLFSNTPGAGYPRPVADEHLRDLQGWLQANGMTGLREHIMLEGLELAAHKHWHHPLRETLQDLAWDGQLRVDHWLATFLGAEDSAYHTIIGRCFLIGMVARVFQPGCKMDYMLVLESEQGDLKSSVARVLAGDAYFSDALPDLAADHVRASQHLRGKWLIEVPEMSAFTRADASRLKSFLTQTTERYLPKYGRIEANEPRQCVFIGTTNKGKYLRDETGGRRFWPVACGMIDIDALAAEREQLIAEAVQLYAAGAQHWPDRVFEREHIAPVQASRYENDAWEEAIADYYGRHPTLVVSLLQVANNALNIQTERLGRAEQNRIIAALEQLGWVKKPRTMNGFSWSAPPSA